MKFVGIYFFIGGFIFMHFFRGCDTKVPIGQRLFTSTIAGLFWPAYLIYLATWAKEDDDEHH